MRLRFRYASLAAVTVVIGLLVHFHGFALGAVIRDMLGDALWAAMIFWLIGIVAPMSKSAVRGAFAYAVCVLLEISQLIHSPGLDAARETTVGHLVLGSGFDVRDLLAYALGVAAAMLIGAGAWFAPASKGGSLRGDREDPARG